MSYDDAVSDAYYDRKLAQEIKWQANQAERKGYYKVARQLWEAYESLLEEAKMEEEKARQENQK